MKPDGVITGALEPMETLESNPVNELSPGTGQDPSQTPSAMEQELAQLTDDVVPPQQEKAKESPAAKTSNKISGDSKAKTMNKTMQKTKPSTTNMTKTTPGPRPNMTQSRLSNGLSKPQSNGVTKKTTPALVKKSTPTSTAPKKLTVGVPASRNTPKVNEKKAASPANNGAKPPVGTTATKKATTTTVNGVKTSTATAIKKPPASKPASATSTKPTTASKTDKLPVSKTRPTSGTTASRPTTGSTRPPSTITTKSPAATPKPATPKISTINNAVSKSASSTPSGVKTSASQISRNIIPAKKDVTKSATPATKKPADSPLSRPSTTMKSVKSETPKPASKLDNIAKKTSVSKIAEAKTPNRSKTQENKSTPSKDASKTPVSKTVAIKNTSVKKTVGSSTPTPVKRGPKAEGAAETGKEIAAAVATAAAIASAAATIVGPEEPQPPAEVALVEYLGDTAEQIPPQTPSAFAVQGIIPEPTPEPSPEQVHELTPEIQQETSPEPSQEPTPEPVQETIPEPMRKPTPESIPQPTPEYIREPTPEFIREPTPEPLREPTPQPIPQPTPEYIREPTPEFIRDPTPEPVREPTPEPIPQPTPEYIREPTPEFIRDPTPEAVREPTPEPIPQPTPEYIREPTPEFIQDATPEPVREPTPEPIPQPTAESILEPTPEPVREPTPEPQKEQPLELFQESSPEPMRELTPDAVQEHRTPEYLHQISPQPRELTPEPIQDSSPEPLQEPAAQPLGEPTPEALRDLTPEPIQEPNHETLLESNPEPLQELTPEPMNELTLDHARKISPEVLDETFSQFTEEPHLEAELSHEPAYNFQHLPQNDLFKFEQSVSESVPSLGTTIMSPPCSPPGPVSPVTESQNPSAQLNVVIQPDPWNMSQTEPGDIDLQGSHSMMNFPTEEYNEQDEEWETTRNEDETEEDEKDNLITSTPPSTETFSMMGESQLLGASPIEDFTSRDMLSPHEKEVAVEKADEEINEDDDEDEEDEEQRRLGHQLSSMITDMSTSQPSEEFQIRPSAFGGSTAWPCDDLLSGMDSEDVSSCTSSRQQGMSDLSSTQHTAILEGTQSSDALIDSSLRGSEGDGNFMGSPNVETLANEEDDEEDERVDEMDLSSERAEGHLKVFQQQGRDEDEEDEDVEMHSEGVTESCDNAEEDDFNEEGHLENLNRADPHPCVPPTTSWGQTNPFSDTWAQPQPASLLSVSSPSPVSDHGAGESESPTQSPAQTGLDCNSPFLAPLSGQDSEQQQSFYEMDTCIPEDTQNMLAPTAVGMSQSGTLSGTALAIHSGSETSTPEELCDYDSSSGVESRSEKQQTPVPVSVQPDMDQDLGIHLEKGDGEEEEATTLPADEVLGTGPPTAPASAPSSPTTSVDEASDTEGEMQINEPDVPVMMDERAAFDSPTPTCNLPALDEEARETPAGEGEEDGGGTTPQSANSVASYGFDCTTSNSNAHSMAESCGKSPGIFSLENEEQLSEEAKDPSLIKELTLPSDAAAAAAAQAEDLLGRPVDLMPLSFPEDKQPSLDDHHYMLGGEITAHHLEEVDPFEASHHLGPVESANTDEGQPSYYSTICDKTDYLEVTSRLFSALPRAAVTVRPRPSARQLATWPRASA
ncbi:cardiomyopathy-associated protein 5 isoform X2 [Phycodurus eques]|uniref:cardiomyopathy-associated protein 5 isoform X2 n=1 Tax=Phycodurus eques TaxID=693459 RepID=UPI002ACED65A|nr:cardiomyopathy-associated protein 5 isoform X2 [Phycodurus eques]